VQIVVTRHSTSSRGMKGLPPSRRPIGRVRLALSALLVGAVFIGLLVAVFVLGSILAAVFLALLIVSLLVFVIKILVGPSRHR
jgi:hypothetical protein